VKELSCRQLDQTNENSFLTGERICDWWYYSYAHLGWWELNNTRKYHSYSGDTELAKDIVTYILLLFSGKSHSVYSFWHIQCNFEVGAVMEKLKKACVLD